MTNKERCKKWREKNRERYNESKKRYYKENKERDKEKRKQYMKKYYQKNKEHYREHNKNWKLKNKEYLKKYYQDNKEHFKKYEKKSRLKCRYGLTPNQVEEMLIRQDYKCPICGRFIQESKKDIDHDHTTNKVRGILCHECNCMIGFSHDNPDTLKNAAIYLQKFQEDIPECGN